MRDIASCGCAALVLLAASISQAQGLPTVASYSGNLHCSAQVGIMQRPAYTEPITGTFDGTAFQWMRTNPRYTETGATEWKSPNPELTVEGRWKPDSGRSGDWKITMALAWNGQEILGVGALRPINGGDVLRNCEARLKPTGGAALATAATASVSPFVRNATPVLPEPGGPLWKMVPAYEHKEAATVLRRSIFFTPIHGAAYREKFEVALKTLPKESLRGVVINNHGCGGMLGWETHTSQFFYQRGFAVVAPDFAARDGNKIGCPGGSSEEMRRMAGVRAEEGTYQAINPARLAARADDVMTVVTWLKTMTTLPILISGHSEGCRTLYSLHLTDPQIVGGICIKQGMQPNYAHGWRWNPQVPMWQSLDDRDPWVVTAGATHVDQVKFTPYFTAYPNNLTITVQAGDSHDPLIEPKERSSLETWLNQRVAAVYRPGLNGFNPEAPLPEVQKKIKAPLPQF